MEQEIEVSDLVSSGLEIRTLQVVRLLGKGAFGKVYLCEVTLSSGETKLLAIKQPKTTDCKMTSSGGSIDEHVVNQRKAYNECLKAGVPTFENFMVLDSGVTIADDLSEAGAFYCLGYSNGKKIRDQIDMITPENFQQTLERILECANIASRAEILLPQDAYLFQIEIDDSKVGTIQSLLVGDFDLVGKVEDSSPEEVLRANKKTAMSAVKFLISRMKLDNEEDLNAIYATQKAKIILE